MSFDSNEWHWKDLTVYANGVRISKIKRAIHKTARELEALHGEGDDAFDVNPGNKEQTGELDLYASQIDRMNRAAQAMGYDDLTDVPWTFVYHYKATVADPQRLITVPNARIGEFETGGANNEKAFVKTLPYTSLKPIYK